VRAAILEKLNEPLVVEDLGTPTMLEVGQVLVEVYRSGICGAQIGEITGAKGPDRYLPHLLGHEGGGVVLDVGPGVKHVKVGDHVVMHWRKGVGIDANPPKYRRSDGRLVGGGWVTTFSEQAVVSENRLTAIDKTIPFDFAALMGCALTTAFGLINNEAQLKIGQSIAVAGCGGVGLHIIQAARMVGANPIIAIDIHQSKLEMAKHFGATHLVNHNIEGLCRDSFYGLAKGGVDVFVDCTGIPSIIEACYLLTAPGGRTILVGQPIYDERVKFDGMRENYCGKTLLDSQGGLTNPTVDIPRYAGLFQAGKLNMNGIVTDYFALDQINEAIAKVRSGEAGRVVLKMR
jgi:S-(hydroxymethyl)glutathione dehydrogenase/alcohol dehydrogenase